MVCSEKGGKIKKNGRNASPQSMSIILRFLRNVLTVTSLHICPAGIDDNTTSFLRHVPAGCI